MRKSPEGFVTSPGKECDVLARIFPCRPAEIETAKSNGWYVVPVEFLSSHRKELLNKTHSPVKMVEPVSEPGIQST